MPFFSELKRRYVPVDAIASELGVGHVVEGSVPRAGDQLRITAQLVRADDGFSLWSESFDRETADTFVVKEDIAVKVDLEAAPDFAARLGESGLQWPPPTSVNFPLKSW